MVGRKRGEMAQARRLLALYDALHRGQTLTNDSLRQEFGISRRQATRDLTALEDVLGGALMREREGGGVAEWSLRPDARYGPVRRWQVLTIALGSRLTGFLAGRRFTAEVRGLLDQLTRELSTHLRHDVSNLLDRIHIVRAGQKRYDREEARQAVLDILTDALLLDRAVALTYHSHRARAAGRSARRLIVAPLTLVLYRTAVYFAVTVVGGEWEGPRRILLALDRIEEAVPTERHVPRPADFDVERWLGPAFAIVRQGEPREVVLRISAEMAPYVRERFWHPTMTATPRDDGDLEVRMRVAGDEVLEWVHTMTPHAEVLAPPDLRAKARRNLEIALARYTDGPYSVPSAGQDALRHSKEEST